MATAMQCMRRAGMLLLGGLATAAAAQPYYYAEPEREGRWEVAIGARYQDLETLDFRDNIKLDVDDSWGVGFSVGYNFSPHLSLALEVIGDEADYEGTVVTAATTPARTLAVSGDLETSTGQLNATWHFFEGALTPFVSGGIGWTYLDSNIVRRFRGVDCWYHPWWGYVCGDVYSTYDDTVFSYNAAVGLRWDITPTVFVRGSIGRMWLDLDDADTAETDMGRFEVGMMF